MSKKHPGKAPGTPSPPFDATKKLAFVKAIEKGLGRYAAAHKIGIAPATPRRHMQTDPEFRAAVSEAEMDALGTNIDEVEDALLTAAKKGNTTALQVFLYNRAPDRWKDKRQINFGFTPDEALKKLSEVVGFTSPAEMLISTAPGTATKGPGSFKKAARPR